MNLPTEYKANRHHGSKYKDGRKNKDYYIVLFSVQRNVFLAKVKIPVHFNLR